MSEKAATILLDKNVVRHALAGVVQRGRGRPLLNAESQSLELFSRLQKNEGRIFIPVASYNVLSRLPRRREIIAFLDAVSVMTYARYSRRWARRLRTFGFTGEDANILSLGSFGVSDDLPGLGANIIVTFDLPMIHNFTVRRSAIEKRFTAMTTQLPSPFSLARLPRLATVEAILTGGR